ncbi:hypothetical protein NPX13_g8982 [Xylaria arbuscula]|uniref:Xylanolytic transcriptional activator regulatory domain-containing protein n=1 Tax=Xylaria arbuscula TaxID=114810 RepID=A0A9W8N786_9PEZI|nr:hypothetical protein NPX13_g8982 [Xylaria arbuscula]
MVGSVAAVGFDDLLQWTESYFNNWHPAFPFLHGPAFLGLLEQVSEHGIEALGQADGIIVRSILSISLADSRQMGSRCIPLPSNLLFLSQDDISASLTYMLSSPATISNIQAALCVELFLISMLNFSMASRVGGIVVRMAFHLGLHRCPSRYPNFGVHDAMMRRRLWWSIYCLDRLVCQTLGSPLGIKDDDLDVCLPSEEIHDQVRDSQNNDAAPQAGRENGNEQLQLLEMLSNHAKLRGMILELRNKSINYRRNDSERALRVQADLKRWANEVYDLTSTHPLSREESDDGDHVSSDSYMSSSQRTLLVIIQQELILSFYRPLLVSDLGTPSSQAAFQECINASKVIIDTAAEASQTYSESEMDLRHGYLLWPSLTWSIWMSCFVLAYATIQEITTAKSARRQVCESCARCLETPVSAEDSVARQIERSALIAPHGAHGARIGQLKHHTEESRTPPPPSYLQNPVTLQNPRPHQTRLDDIGVVNWQPPNIRPPVGATTSGTTDTQDQAGSGFADFYPNLTSDYPDTLGMTDCLYTDPLLALDFANFAQDPDTQGRVDFSLG